MAQENTRIFNFEGLLGISDEAIQRLLRQLEMNELSLCLKGASPQIRDKFLANMSERACEMLQDEITKLGPVRISDVEEAQMRVVDIARKL
jgi:flagellar motor switch protein FliG